MNFRIKYEYGNLKDKEIIVKNVSNKFFAELKLHTWLENKYGKAELIVFSNLADYGFNSDKDLLDFFGGIFK